MALRRSRTVDEIVGVRCNNINRDYGGKDWPEIVVTIKEKQYLTFEGQLIEHQGKTYIRSLGAEVDPESFDTLVLVYASHGSPMERSNLRFSLEESEDYFLYKKR